MNPRDDTLYHVSSAKLLSDGVLRVPAGGTTGDSLWTGYYDVPPDSPDYDLWIWLTKRFKRSDFSWKPGKSVTEEEIAKYREEYERKRH